MEEFKGEVNSRYKFLMMDYCYIQDDVFFKSPLLSFSELRYSRASTASFKPICTIALAFVRWMREKWLMTLTEKE